MSKNSLVVALKKTRMGWCVYLNHEPFAIGSHAYCQEVSRGLILRHLQHGPDALPHQFVVQKGGAA